MTLSCWRAATAPAAPTFIAGPKCVLRRRWQGLRTWAQGGPGAGRVAEVILRKPRRWGQGHPWVGLLAVGEAGVSYHDAWWHSTVGVPAEGGIVGPRRAGVVQEGLLTKSQVIHHSCVGSARLWRSKSSAEDETGSVSKSTLLPEKTHDCFHYYNGYERASWWRPCAESVALYNLRIHFWRTMISIHFPKTSWWNIHFCYFLWKDWCKDSLTG